MVQTKELRNHKKQVKRLKAKIAVQKCDAVVSDLRLENRRLRQKIARLEERLKKADLAIVERMRLKEKVGRPEERVVEQKVHEFKRVLQKKAAFDMWW